MYILDTDYSDFLSMLKPFLCLSYAYIQILILDIFKYRLVVKYDIFEYLDFSQYSRSILWWWPHGIIGF